ncbi:MAG: cytochrome C [Cytophagales bacterium]|nr:MAG: cytochrome C [Cytophagales bacterium]
MENKELNQKLRYLIGLLAVIPLAIVLLLGLLVAQMLGLRINVDIYWKETANTANNSVVVTKPAEAKASLPTLWQAPDTSTIPQDEQGKLIRYGRELIKNTSAYLGKNGSVAKMSNDMNCQNCHLEAGTKPFGNNYSAVASTYPKFRERSGTVETIPKRVNDCLERSLNGKPLDTASREMQAIVEYIHWLGKDVKKEEKPAGAGILELAYMDRAASPEKGKIVYEKKCFSCHQLDGSGVPDTEKGGYQYPPLWGKNSYNNGAGLFRLSRFAGYVKANMPLGASYNSPLLTDEEAWDIAAYVNSMPRPDVRKTVMKNDWKNIAGKPIDHPFAPFADGFSEEQHKFGNFKPIIAARKK